MSGRDMKFYSNVLTPNNHLTHLVCIWQKLKSQFILLFNLFLLLLIDPAALFGTIHGSHCTIQLTYTFIYSTFSKKFSVLTK